MLSICRHKSNRISDLHVLATAGVFQAHAFLILAGTDAHEGYPVAMPGIHIRLYLEYEPGQV